MILAGLAGSKESLLTDREIQGAGKCPRLHSFFAPRPKVLRLAAMLFSFFSFIC